MQIYNYVGWTILIKPQVLCGPIPVI